jgi:hypothetical protein
MKNQARGRAIGLRTAALGALMLAVTLIPGAPAPIDGGGGGGTGPTPAKCGTTSSMPETIQDEKQVTAGFPPAGWKYNGYKNVYVSYWGPTNPNPGKVGVKGFPCLFFNSGGVSGARVNNPISFWTQMSSYEYSGYAVDYWPVGEGRFVTEFRAVPSAVHLEVRVKNTQNSYGTGLWGLMEFHPDAINKYGETQTWSYSAGGSVGAISGDLSYSTSGTDVNSIVSSNVASWDQDWLKIGTLDVDFRQETGTTQTAVSGWFVSGVSNINWKQENGMRHNIRVDMRIDWDNCQAMKTAGIFLYWNCGNAIGDFSTSTSFVYGDGVYSTAGVPNFDWYLIAAEGSTSR